MFHADITLTLALIALAIGAHLALSAKMRTDISTLAYTFIGYIVIIVALIILLFSGFSIMGRTMMGYQMHTQMMQLRQGQMMPHVTHLYLQRQRMLRNLKAQQMPVHSMPKATKNMPMHGKTPSETIKK